ncbi:hypothetical protein KBC04_02065 [Candidatus Babeliales bacterium]|nr:hypothetical protein [Candidatus Babeliales bacterium]MBP9843805.1 hypothetical protein [Candidatus Babeliales bacterium]
MKRLQILVAFVMVMSCVSIDGMKNLSDDRQVQEKFKKYISLSQLTEDQRLDLIERYPLALTGLERRTVRSDLIQKIRKINDDLHWFRGHYQSKPYFSSVDDYESMIEHLQSQLDKRTGVVSWKDKWETERLLNEYKARLVLKNKFLDYKDLLSVLPRKQIKEQKYCDEKQQTARFIALKIQRSQELTKLRQQR